MIDSLLQLDERIFLSINKGLSNTVFDAVLPIMREPKTWIPLYIFLIGYFIYCYRWKALYYIGGLLLAFGLADTISAHIIKPLVHRLRPCNTPSLSDLMVHRLSCGSGFSFPSSHATNHFAIACFLIGILGAKYSWIRPTALFWAALISFSQVYVGVHYPIDITIGALLGSLIGYGTATFFNYLKPKF